MKVLVTGGAGFIGSNLIKFLNEKDVKVTVLEDFDRMHWQNLADLEFEDLIDKDKAEDIIYYRKYDCVVHLGAITDTSCTNFKLLYENNYKFTTKLIESCSVSAIPVIYASSAAVYGIEGYPINEYGFSKLLIDNYVRRFNTSHSIPIIGLRFFNVYGPREGHKGDMASIIYQKYHEITNQGKATLFHPKGVPFQRDFVYVDDVVKVIWYFITHPKSGIYDVGTGIPRTFEYVVDLIFQTLKLETNIKYKYMPICLKNRYQPFTMAKLEALRDAGYEDEFTQVYVGVKKYVEWLKERSVEI